MRSIFIIALAVLSLSVSAQNITPEKLGFRHLQMLYKNDTVDILIRSKKGEEAFPKPLLLFCQGSLPQPLIKTDGKEVYGVFPFNADSLAVYFHIAIVSKPYVPLIMDKKDLGTSFCFLDSAGKVTKEYSDRNLLSYYVKRDIDVIKYLQKQKWISSNKLVVAGHSEGATVAAKLSSEYPKITHLIYSGGNPFGRIMSIIGQSRSSETDSTNDTEGDFELWKNAVAAPENMDHTNGDTYKATIEFSQPAIGYLLKLSIPVFDTYGSKDQSAPFNDYLRIKMIQAKKNNFTFKSYIGTEHNYFPLKANGEINYDIFNWDKVATDWLAWLKNN